MAAYHGSYRWIRSATSHGPDMTGRDLASVLTATGQPQRALAIRREAVDQVRTGQPDDAPLAYRSAADERAANQTQISMC